MRSKKRGSNVGTLALSAAIVALALLAVPASAGEPCGDWEVVPSPNPGPRSNSLRLVAGLGTSGALAVGYANPGYFTLEWDGATWSEIALPDPDDIGMAYDISGIGTTPEGDVWVVGIVQVGVWTALPLAMRYNGTDWDVIETITLDPDGRNGHANDVSAVSEDDVWAVGNVTGGELAVHWDGSTWTEIAPPTVGDRQNNVHGVAAAASDDVWAVGDYSNWTQDPLGSFALILHWDGSAWSHFPNPARTIHGTHLSDVEAVSPNDVWAVGYWDDGAFFMHWDGTEWSIVPGPSTASPFAGELTVLASDDVWARTGLEYIHWDGTAWSVVPAPEVPGAEAASHGASMAAVGPCEIWAVGGYTPFGGGDTRTLAERLTPGSPTSVGHPVDAPRGDLLYAGTPNPFGSHTELTFQLVGSGPVTLDLIDVRGQKVVTLVSEWRPAGTHTVPFLAEELASGTYFARLETRSGVVTTRLILVR